MFPFIRPCGIGTSDSLDDGSPGAFSESVAEVLDQGEAL